MPRQAKSTGLQKTAAAAAYAQLLGLEESVARCLPGSAAHDRKRLLAELSDYATTVVDLSRREATTVSSHSQEVDIPRWLDHPVFVCGAHRSGTTLMQQLLDCHPELLVLPSEATYFTSFHYAARPNPPAQDVDRFIADWICRLVDPNCPPHFRLGRGACDSNPSLLFAAGLREWHATLRRVRPAQAPFALLLALVAAFREVAAPTTGIRMWVEKTPRNELHLSRLLAFRQARFIQMVRDPASSLHSLRAARRKAALTEFDTFGHALDIGRSLRLAHRHAAKHLGRYLVVRYEDLTTDPAGTMREVSEFLGISFDPALLTPTAGGLAVQSNSSFERTVAGTIRTPQALKVTCAQDARAIGAAVGAAAPAFGYTVMPVGLSLRTALQVQHLVQRLLRRISRA